MSSSSPNRPVYFPGLNGLRFFAALAVIITHVELTKSFFRVNKNLYEEPIFFSLGSLGVIFFFVLSGFLITYLLLKEKEVTGGIGVGKFYLRRIFRIWPLYYLIMVFGFFILPRFEWLHVPFQEKHFVSHYYDNMLLYLIILPNLAFSFFQAVPHIGQLWSIGVEEQFYLFWPWIIKYAKKVTMTLIILIVLLVALKVAYLFLPAGIKASWWYPGIKRFLAMSKIECMAIGGLGACWLYYQNNRILKIVYSPAAIWLSLSLIPVLIYFTPGAIQDGIHLVFSLIFLTIILNMASNSKVWLKMEGRTLYELGNISYGIYMYHLMFCGIVIALLKPTRIGHHPLWGNILIYALVIGITITVSYFSYRGFEKPFIKLKERFARIKSGRPS